MDHEDFIVGVLIAARNLLALAVGLGVLAMLVHGCIRETRVACYQVIDVHASPPLPRLYIFDTCRGEAMPLSLPPGDDAGMLRAPRPSPPPQET